MGPVILLLGLLLSVNSFAQGLILAGNRNLTSGGNAPISDAAGDPLPSGFVAQLFAMPEDGNSFSPLLPILRFRTTSRAAAYFLEGPTTIVVPEIPPAAPAIFRLRVYQEQYGTYENAVARGGCTAESNDIFVPELGDGSLPHTPLTPPDLSGLQPIVVQCIPEPSVLALAIMSLPLLRSSSRCLRQ